MITQDLAWAAGLFEGEGSICFVTASDNVRASLAMTDQDVVERFQRIVNRGRIYKRKGTNKPVWSWIVTGLNDVQALVNTFWDLFGERRRAQATRVLDRYRASAKRRHSKRRVYLSTTQKDEIVRLRYEGATCRAIADRFNVTPNAISKTLAGKAVL